MIKDGFIWGRGTVDDKDKLVAMLTIMTLMKRSGLTLDRDLIFLAESVRKRTRQASASISWLSGISRRSMRIRNHRRRHSEAGKWPRNGLTDRNDGESATPRRLVATGTSGHGSVPRVDNPLIHLGMAIAKLGAWETPMHLKETTRVYLQRLASMSPPDKAARYQALLNPQRANQVQRYLAENEPVLYSMLRTSVVPTMMKAGVGANVIPSEAEATLDIRALPGEDINEFYDEIRRVIGDPAVKVVPIPNSRPEAPRRVSTRRCMACWKKSVNGCIREPWFFRRCPPALPTWLSFARKEFLRTASVRR